jgi:rhodanese-related sulfurtransferase
MPQNPQLQEQSNDAPTLILYATTMKAKFILLGLLILIGLAYSYAVFSPYRISSEDAKEKIKKGEFDVILDVRTDYEVATLGKYPGSVHIQSADLDVEMPKRYPDRKTKILAYCNTGHRARLATDKLHGMGYKNSSYISSQYTTLL